jgi:hypothetical protein
MFAKVKLEAETQSAKDELMFMHVLSCMTDCGFGSLHGYLHWLITTKAQHASSQASKLLISEGTGLLNDMCNKQPAFSHVKSMSITAKSCYEV